ncbi:hypothetical protein BDZ45DRAFT_744088 [Acephala macrosclerotiorum]|nr:hypothetical protein BDZ45DRAFT_744088 [Acephala macrosclerotiorum]
MARSLSVMSSSLALLFLFTSLVSALPASQTTPDGNPSVLTDPSDNRPQSTSTSSSSNSYSSKGQAAAGIIGVILLLSVVGGLFYWFHRRTRPGRNANVGKGEEGEQDGKRRWPMPMLAMGKVIGKENGKGEEWKKGKWEELN